MSRLAEYRSLEQKLAAQLAELESLRNSSGLQREMEFETKLRELLSEYGYGLESVVAILEPSYAAGREAGLDTSGKKTRKPRKLKVYRNPYNGETAKTKGGNHRLLKIWKAEHGNKEVESWLCE